MMAKHFADMTREELLFQREDHMARLESGKGSDAYRDLLRAALRSIADHLATKEPTA